MNAANHTPGPWRFDICWDILGNTDDGNGLICAVTYDGVAGDEAAANAHLISAAPDMLAALIAQEAADEANEARLDYEQWQRLEDEAKALRLAAIAKAEGCSS